LTKNKDKALPIDYEEVTDIFLKLKPAVAKVSNIKGFLAVTRPAVFELVTKYSNPPKGKSYKAEDLDSLTDHIVDCINNIMPAFIPFRGSINADKRLIFTRIDKNAPKGPRPN
jgi:hypothetical protein